ncbi:DUF4916 domain-containing protein [Saccharopolyspora spinosa]|uniref:DUF4916 domain-containing protein n=1 Tax=Saccharopolyspora spinosa TaxID=60894 RepID=UPI0009FBA13D
MVPRGRRSPTRRTAAERRLAVFDWARGDRVSLDLDTVNLKEVAEYFPDPDTGEFFDPRKHAVALTYTCVMSGDPCPRGKAIDFRWSSSRPASRA